MQLISVYLNLEVCFYACLYMNGELVNVIEDAEIRRLQKTCLLFYYKKIEPILSKSSPPAAYSRKR